MDWIKIKAEHLSTEYTNYEVGMLVRYQFLVARLKRIPSEKEIRIELPPKRLQNLERKILNLYQIDLKTIANRVLIDVKTLENVREYEKERKRKYRESKGLSRGTVSDSPTVEEIREDEIREDKSIPIVDDSSTTKEKIVKYSADDMRLAELLRNLIKENSPTFKEPDLDKWADEIRLLREQDKRSSTQIEYVIRWAQKDSFWKANILSPKKLRKQFDTCVAKIQSDRDGGGKGKKFIIANQS